MGLNGAEWVVIAMKHGGQVRSWAWLAVLAGWRVAGGGAGCLRSRGPGRELSDECDEWLGS
jgi:hypothetical protein